MASIKLLEGYVFPPLADIIKSYTEAWIDIDRILFFLKYFVHYDWYTKEEEEFGLAESNLMESFDGCYHDIITLDHKKELKDYLIGRNGYIESDKTVYDISTRPILKKGITLTGTISFIYM